MGDSSEVDALYLQVEGLLRQECETDDYAQKRNLVEEAISIANSLVSDSPQVADSHYLLGLAWYHHPNATQDRFQKCQASFAMALQLDPGHHFANQYLGYAYFDAGKYSDAHRCFDATDHDFFESHEQKWRSLKATELALVCRLRSDQAIEEQHLQHFFADYLAEECQAIPNTAVPLELRRCAEWLYDRNGDAEAEPLRSIVDFLHACGDLARSDHAALRASRNSQ